MKRFVGLVLSALLISINAYAEKNPLVGMWVVQESTGKADQTDPMGAAFGMLSPRIGIFQALQ